jgi:hypothetical protein
MLLKYGVKIIIKENNVYWLGGALCPKRCPDKNLDGDQSGFGEHLASMGRPDKIPNGDCVGV